MESVTVQAAWAPLAKVDGVQLTLVTTAGAASVTVAGEEDVPRVAVTTAGWLLLTAAALAVNCPLEAPLATLTEAGTVRLLLFEDRPTVVADAALADKVTVHCVVPAPVNVAGLQLIPLMAVEGFTVSCVLTLPPNVAVNVTAA